MSPYSPDLNLIENIFSKVKQLIRACKPRSKSSRPSAKPCPKSQSMISKLPSYAADTQPHKRESCSKRYLGLLPSSIWSMLAVCDACKMSKVLSVFANLLVWTEHGQLEVTVNLEIDDVRQLDSGFHHPLVRSSRICSVLADCVGFWQRWSASTNHEDSPVSTALPELPHSRQ